MHWYIFISFFLSFVVIRLHFDLVWLSLWLVIVSFMWSDLFKLTMKWRCFFCLPFTAWRWVFTQDLIFCHWTNFEPNKCGTFDTKLALISSSSSFFCFVNIFFSIYFSKMGLSLSFDFNSNFKIFFFFVFFIHFIDKLYTNFQKKYQLHVHFSESTMHLNFNYWFFVIWIFFSFSTIVSFYKIVWWQHRIVSTIVCCLNEEMQRKRTKYIAPDSKELFENNCWLTVCVFYISIQATQTTFHRKAYW